MAAILARPKSPSVSWRLKLPRSLAQDTPVMLTVNSNISFIFLNTMGANVKFASGRRNSQERQECRIAVCDTVSS